MPRPSLRPPEIVVSCEHAGRTIPAPWRAAFEVPGDVLASHRGFDAGSVAYGRQIATTFGAPCLENHVTRLLVDTNRSERNPARYSEFARRMPRDLVERAHAEVWSTHREAVADAVRRAIECGGPVLHVAAHSFTPELEGMERRVDVGLLYDPSLAAERDLARRWKARLAGARPDLRVRSNAPYRGTADGLTRSLRRRFGSADYRGIEVEVSQRFPLDATAAGRAAWRELQRSLVRSLEDTLGG